MKSKTITMSDVSSAFMRNYFDEIKMLYTDSHEGNFLVTAEFYGIGTVQIAYIKDKWLFYISSTLFGLDTMTTISNQLGIQPEECSQFMTQETFTYE
jgi:tRNA(His) 5'-end guanylyltransferase